MEKGLIFSVAIDSSSAVNPMKKSEQLIDLYEELRHVPRAKVSLQSGEAPAPGSKSDMGTWAQILISLGAAGALLPTTVTVLRDWLMRQPPTTNIKLKHGDLELEITSAATREELADALNLLLNSQG